MKILIALQMLFFQAAWADFYSDAAPFSILGQEMDGFKVIRKLPPSSALSRLGIEKGDIVLAVNDRPIINTEAAQQAYSSNRLSTATILRNGRKIRIGVQ